MNSIAWRDVWRMRVRRHWLAQPAPAEQMLDVVGDVCGIHAQMAVSAELSLGLRVRDITRQHIRDALWRERSLVKTYGLRGTLHLLPSHELALWLAALRARTPPRGGNATLEQALPARRRGIVVQAMVDALGDRALTREELAAELEKRLGAWATEPTLPAFGGQWPRWQLALGPAAHAGWIVFGPNRGNLVTYVRTDRWLGTQADWDGQAALREVARRYFHAYGPATAQEFARWFTMQPKAARELVASLVAEGVLDPVTVVSTVDGAAWRAFAVPDADDAGGRADEPERRVHLLPHFDCYVVGSFPRDQLVPASAPAVMRRGTAAPFPVVLVDGVVAGVWERQRRGQAFALRVDTFAALGVAEQAAVVREAERIGQILEAPVEVAFGPVEPRGHL